MIDKKQKSGQTRKPNDSWSIRGVSPETRQAAKRAARKSGQTLGAWLDDQIRLAATQKLSEGALVKSGGEDTQDAINAILERLTALEKSKQNDTPSPSFWRRFFGGR